MNSDPKEIAVSAILEALEGSYQIEEEEMPEDSHGRSIAVSIQELVIDQVNNQLEHMLKNITLDDLREKYLESKEYNQDMYYI